MAKTFAQFLKKKENGGKASLRRKQWNLAEKNATMAIWLGKQYLGQSDIVELKPLENRVVIVDDLPTEEDKDATD